MASTSTPTPRKRLASPRKRLPPAPFNQTWHHSDTARLDPGALPVARIPRAWERTRKMKQASDGRAKSIWRRFSPRSQQAQDETEEEVDDDDDNSQHEAHARAVKRRQRMSPAAMEKMQRTRRAFHGTRWELTKTVLPRKRVSHARDGDDDDAEDDDAEDDDAEDDTVDDMVDTSDTVDTPDDTPHSEELAEDSTFAFIFKSPLKTMPAHVDYPILPNSQYEQDEHGSLDHVSDHPQAMVQSEHVPNTSTPPQVEPAQVVDEDEDEDVELSEVDIHITEASLQVNIQEEYEREGEIAAQPPTPTSTADVGAIAEGLSLSLTPTQPKKLHSPPPPLHITSAPDDATMTLAIDDDTAILKSFLSRAAASKAERSAIITRRSSLENRRDSDIVRHALASPRKALEEKDPNSPTKVDSDATLDMLDMAESEVIVDTSPTQEHAQVEDGADSKPERGSRRSSRAKKSRLPAPASSTQPQTNKIAIRRADGSDPVVLKKTDAQELALITRNNTRKNKHGAFMVSLRLLKLQAEAILSPPLDMDADAEKPPVPGRRGIRWDETLAYYQEHADTIAAQKAEAESLATPDELSLPVPAAKAPKAKTADKTSTPKIRRVRGLGTANGTPGKGLLVSGSLLSDAVQEEKVAVKEEKPAASPAKSIPKPKLAATRKLPLPTVSTEKPSLPPAGPDPAPPQRKSRIAPPKTVRLSKPVTPVPASTSTPISIAPAEKENPRTNIAAATPRKGIPAPRAAVKQHRLVAGAIPVASAGESALPRRRGRRV